MKKVKDTINSPDFFPETSICPTFMVQVILYTFYHYHSCLITLLDCKLFERRVISDLSLNFPQDWEKCLTHNGCSVKGHRIDDSISKSERKRKFQVWSCGKWFGICFIPMTNDTKRRSLEPSPRPVSRTGDAANRSSDFSARAKCSISAAWTVAVACLSDTGDSAPEPGHRLLASEIFLRTIMTY